MAPTVVVTPMRGIRQNGRDDNEDAQDAAEIEIPFGEGRQLSKACVSRNQENQARDERDAIQGHNQNEAEVAGALAQGGIDNALMAMVALAAMPMPRRRTSRITIFPVHLSGLECSPTIGAAGFK